MRSGFAAVLLFSQLFPPLLMPALPRSPQKPAGALPSSEAAIEAVLRTQQEAWNHHDLDAFMAGYWNSPELTFFSGANERDGWQATLDRYRAAYAGPGREMGKLEFSGAAHRNAWLRCGVRARVVAFTMPDGKTPHGLLHVGVPEISQGGGSCTTILRWRSDLRTGSGGYGLPLHSLFHPHLHSGAFGKFAIRQFHHAVANDAF